MRLSALTTPVLSSSTVGSSSRAGRSLATSRASKTPTARCVMEAAPPARDPSVSAAASNARMIGS